jgi:hypothetical protein
MRWTYDDVLALPGDVYDILLDVIQEEADARGD